MPAVTQREETLTGELTAFRAVGSDGWGYGKVADGDRQVAVVGKLVGVQPGRTVEITGVWVEHPRHGLQLRVQRCTPVDAVSEVGVMAWLVSTLPDIGVGRARALVERFGGQLWDVIADYPERLCEIAGITPARAEAIHAAYMEHRAERDAMITLRGWGLTDSQIARCIEAWKTLEDVIEHVRENPYALSRRVHGFGFVRADAVAMRAGVAFNAPARITAAVEHVLEEARAEGHCYLPTGRLAREVTALLGAIEMPEIAEAVRQAIRVRHAVRRGKRVYVAGIDTAEQRCAERLRALLKGAA